MSPESELLRDLLSATDRDHIPGAAPIVSYREDEDEDFAKDLREYTASRIELSRRGAWHGRLAELIPGSLPKPEAEPDLKARWRSSKPFILRGVLSDRFRRIADDTELAVLQFSQLKRPNELRVWITDRLASTKPGPARFSVLPQGSGPNVVDRQRDIARVGIRAETRAKDGTKEVYDDLWIKVGKLSNNTLDGSIRVRFSFGNEIADDANPDPIRTRLVSELAARCVPAAARIRDSTELMSVVNELAERPLFTTQQIAYWNAPEGGALFHHDSFGGPAAESDATNQLGVVFAQVGGRTAWLALSIEDLATRVREFTGHLSDGQLPWVRAEVFPEPDAFQAALDLVDDRPALLRELAMPGCGRLAQLVNRGPEFTSFLADCGHASVLRPGDAIVLPNHSLQNTAMHSVFCASPDVTFGVSCALRALPGIKPLSREVVKRGKGIQKRGHRPKRRKKG